MTKYKTNDNILIELTMISFSIRKLREKKILKVLMNSKQNFSLNDFSKENLGYDFRMGLHYNSKHAPFDTSAPTFCTFADNEIMI